MRVHYAPISILRRRFSPAELALFGPTVVARGGGPRHPRAPHRRRPDSHQHGGRAGRGHRRTLAGRCRTSCTTAVTASTNPVGSSICSPWIWTGLSDRVFCISEVTSGIFTQARIDGAKVSTLYNPIDVAGVRATRAALARSGRRSGRATATRWSEPWAASIPERISTPSCAPPRWRRGIGRAHGSSSSAPPRAPARRPISASCAPRPRGWGSSERLVFAGARRDMPETFKALDVFVLASRHEGFGRVVAEAMAAGIPSVVSREGALPELVSGRAARPVRDARRPGRLRREDRAPHRRFAELRATLGAAARERSRAFDAVACAERVLATYRTLCKMV